MHRRRLFVLPLLCLLALVAPGCTTRTTTSPPPLIPGGQTPTVAPTKKPAQTQAGAQFVRPDVQMTAQGTLESGIPFGTAEGDHYFMGDPQAPVMIIEFSDYQ